MPSSFALVDRLAGAGREARGVGAVVADAGHVEEPQGVRLAFDVRTLWHLSARDHVFTDVGVVPVLVAGSVADHLLVRLIRSLEDRLAFVVPSFQLPGPIFSSTVRSQAFG